MLVEIDGNDGTGKTTLIESLKNQNLDNVEILDRGQLTQFTDIYEDELPNELLDDRIYILLDAEINECTLRLLQRGPLTDKYEQYRQLFKYQKRFRRLAVKYSKQVYYIDTTHLRKDEVFQSVYHLITTYIKEGETKKIASLKLPNPDTLTEKQFNELSLVAEGNSKVVRNFNKQFNLIKYKPTIYSHKKQRAGIIEGTDIQRRQMTKDILYLLEAECIDHAYWYVGKNYVLCEKLDLKTQIPPIEVIVKRCYVGTDKYKYYNLDQKVSRRGKAVVESEYKIYPQPIVRFDYRNPNHIVQELTSELLPKGDEVICDDLADLFIDVKEAKNLALKTFKVLNQHFQAMEIFLEDICFMITTDGTKHWSEISQDCGRYKKVNIEKLEDLDKDVWRAGGSSELVHEKWHQMTTLVHEYVKENYENL